MALGNLTSNQNNNPELTQDQPTNAQFGSGQNPTDTIPNMTRKVQYAAEGNDFFSQMISAGDTLLHRAGLDYGSGEVNPNHYDIVNAMYDMAKAPSRLYNARADENNRIRQNTQNANLNQSFLNNLGDNIGQAGQSDIERYGNMRNLHQEDDENNTAAMNIANLSTKDAMDAYHQLLSNVRGNPAQQISTGQLYQMRRLHNELARRGIDTSIFDKAHNLDDDEQRSLIDEEMKNHNNRYHLFHENPLEFHQRTRLFDFPAGHPVGAASGIPAAPPPPQPAMPPGWAGRAPAPAPAPQYEPIDDGRLEANRDYSRVSPEDRRALIDRLTEESNRRYHGVPGAQDPALGHLSGVDIDNMINRLNIAPPPPAAAPAGGPQVLRPGMNLEDMPLDELNTHMFNLRRPPTLNHPEYNHLDVPHRTALADEIDNEITNRDRLDGADNTLALNMPLHRFSRDWLREARNHTYRMRMLGPAAINADARLPGLTVRNVHDLHTQLHNEILRREARPLEEQGLTNALNAGVDIHRLPQEAARHVYMAGGTPEQAAEARIMAANHIIEQNPRTAPQRRYLQDILADPNSTPEERDRAVRGQRFKFNLDALSHMENGLPDLRRPNDPLFDQAANDRNVEERRHLHTRMAHMAQQMLPDINTSDYRSDPDRINTSAYLHSIMGLGGLRAPMRHLDDFRNADDLRRMSGADLENHLFHNSLTQNEMIQGLPTSSPIYRNPANMNLLLERNAMIGEEFNRRQNYRQRVPAAIRRAMPRGWVPRWWEIGH
ncbi:MAG: hypothetical protein LBK92_02845 [Endomicrobium sp.]|jgi:hypothetical protein|nr:hypothetical protein [Endomicrobium sp.]